VADKILKEAFDKMVAIEEEIVDEGEPNYGALEAELDGVREGIDEFETIQEQLFEAIEALDSAIRAYAPRSHAYWQSYGLAQLKIVAGSDEYATHDKSINSLIEELRDEAIAIQGELDQ